MGVAPVTQLYGAKRDRFGLRSSFIVRGKICPLTQQLFVPRVEPSRPRDAHELPAYEVLDLLLASTRRNVTPLLRSAKS